METTAPSSVGRLPCYWSPVLIVVIAVLLLPPSPSSLRLPLSATNSPPAHYYSFSTVSEVAADTVGVETLTASLSSSSLGPSPSPADMTLSEGEREERMVGLVRRGRWMQGTSQRIITTAPTVESHWVHMRSRYPDYEVMYLQVRPGLTMN